MGKIICLMGKSSSGKDTIYKELLARGDLMLHTITPYTTRPIRDGEKEGVEYHFTDEAGFQKLLADGRIIEERSYNTAHGLWRYFTVADGSIDIENNNYCMIGTLEAYVSLRDYFGKEKVVPVMVDLDDGVRLERALARERAQEVPKYVEMCRRFLADSKDFSEENLAKAEIDRRFINGDLDETESEIVAYIKSFKTDE